MWLVKHDHMIEELATTASHPSFRGPVVSRTLEEGSDRTAFHWSNCRWNLQTILRIAIQDENLRSRLMREGFPMIP